MKILILTTENDISTNEIMDWLFFFLPNSQIKRCNNLDEIDASDLNENTIIFTRKIKQFILEEKKELRLRDLKSELLLKKALAFNTKLEISSLIKYLIKSKNHTVIGNRELYPLNKLHQLQVAKKNGLLVPKWLITDSLIELQTFYKKHHKSIISKQQSR